MRLRASVFDDYEGKCVFLLSSSRVLIQTKGELLDMEEHLNVAEKKFVSYMHRRESPHGDKF